jgi:hypothetical protein
MKVLMVGAGGKLELMSRALGFDDKMDIGWQMAVVLPPVFQYERSFAQYPKIKPGEEFTGFD